jgi:hypothetical protein
MVKVVGLSRKTQYKLNDYLGRDWQGFAIDFRSRLWSFSAKRVK